MASLLAMQCLVRGSEPTDFAILVPAEQTLADRLTSRAKELLEEGRAVANPESLSPRQKEILQSVICNEANKEIASKLNITVRTVKFHISSLLGKFGVENRVELARRASGFLRSTLPGGETLEFNEALASPRGRELGPIAMNSPAHLGNKTRSIRFPQRVLSA
jgi:DNA-binding CsgD family transcriptional regulator